MSSTRTKRTTAARRSTSDQASSPTAAGNGTSAADTPQSPNGTLGLLLGLAEATSLTSPLQTSTLPAPAQSHPPAIASLQPSAGAPVINSYTTLARPPFPAASTTYSSILSQRPVASAASSHTKAATLFSNPLNAPSSLTPTAVPLSVSYTGSSAPLSAQQLDDSLRASLNAKAAAQQAKSNAAAAAAAAAVAAASSSAAAAPIHANYPAPVSLQQPLQSLQQTPTALPVAPVAAAAAAANATTKLAGRRQKNSVAVAANADAAPATTKAEKASRSSAAASGNHHPASYEGTGHVDKQKKRLLRKAELARASRRRKKAYVGDLESKCAQLIAQSGFLLSLINKTPSLLAAVRYDAQRLPAGLSFEPATGLLKCHIDVQRELDGSDGELDGESGADSDAEVEPAAMAYEPSTASMKLDSTSIAPASSVAPSDLVVLAHAMTEVGAGGSLNDIAATPGPVLTAHPSRAPQLSSLFIPASSASSSPATTSPPISQHQPSAASAVTLEVVSPPIVVVASPPATAADHVVIKCSFRGEWRRFTISAAQFTFPHLQQTLHNLLLSDSLPASATPPPAASALIIKYVDDQGDEILIRSTAELLDARKFSETLVKDESHANASAARANDCLRLYVTEASPSSAAAVVPSTPVPPSTAATQSHKRKSVEPDLQAFVKAEVSEEKMMDEEKKVALPVAKESLSKRAKLEAASAN